MNTTQNPNLISQDKWYLINAQGKTLGRLSTQIAKILRGKTNPLYSPSYHCKDHIIIINAKDIQVTGQKKSQKLYHRHSGRPGGLKVETFENLQNRLPTRIIENSVKRMLPKGALGRQIFKNLKVYSNSRHPHQAQNPITIEI